MADYNCHNGFDNCQDSETRWAEDKVSHMLKKLYGLESSSGLLSDEAIKIAEIFDNLMKGEPFGPIPRTEVDRNSGLPDELFEWEE